MASITNQFFCMFRMKLEDSSLRPIELPLQYHVAMTSQLEDFVDKINLSRCCVHQGCHGKCALFDCVSLGCYCGLCRNNHNSP